MKLTFTKSFPSAPLAGSKNAKERCYSVANSQESTKVKRPRYSVASNSVISGASILDFDSNSLR